MSFGLRVAVLASDSYTKEARLLLLQSQPDVTVVYTSSSPADALVALGDYLVDVVLLDSKVPGFKLDSYVKLLGEALEEAGNPARILVTGNFLSARLVFECLANGAAEVIDGDAGAEKLLREVRFAAKGEIPVNRDRLAELLTTLGRMPAPKGVLAIALEKMDEKQKAVIEQLLSGKTDAQIAKDSGLAKYRVSKFLDTLVSSSGLRTRTQLAIELLLLGAL
jgi:DNA-binding NarL/FixJ family response regulator